MATRAQLKARALFAKRAKSGAFQKAAVFTKDQIRRRGVSVKTFVSNLRRAGYKARERVDGSVRVNLRK